MAIQVKFEDLRSLAFGSISANYAALGSALTHPARIITLTNNTEGDLLVTTDNTKDQLFIAAGSFKLYDLQSNITPHRDDRYALQVGTQFYVKQLTAPVSGSVYLETIY